MRVQLPKRPGAFYYNDMNTANDVEWLYDKGEVDRYITALLSIIDSQGQGWKPIDKDADKTRNLLYTPDATAELEYRIMPE